MIGRGFVWLCVGEEEYVIQISRKTQKHTNTNTNTRLHIHNPIGVTNLEAACQSFGVRNLGAQKVG